VNDRGPFLHNRLIDLSYAAAARLGIIGTGTGLVEVETVGPGYVSPGESVVASGADAAKPSSVEIFPAAQAAPVGGAPVASSAPTLYVQVGAFNRWDNAVALRTRLEQAALRPIFIQSVLAPGAGEQRLYRVRIGPIANVEEGDRLTERAAKLGVPDALIVVE
jgi:rare lipoprotein A